MNTALNRSVVLYRKNNSGIILAQGDIVSLTTGVNTESVFTLPLQTGMLNTIIGVVADPNGIGIGGYGNFIIDGYIPRINITASGNSNDFVVPNGNSRLGTAKSIKDTGMFAQLLANGTSPDAIFINNKNTSYAAVADQKSSGTNGGTFTAGSWITHTLNTKLYDPDNIVTLNASNQFILQAGTYRIFARSTAYKVDNHQIRLRNITDGVTISVGILAMSGTLDTVATDTNLVCMFTIPSAKTFELQARCETTTATMGFGRGIGNLGENIIYAQVDIEKIY